LVSKPIPTELLPLTITCEPRAIALVPAAVLVSPIAADPVPPEDVLAEPRAKAELAPLTVLLSPKA
jgi:hypothetical protein